MEERVKNNIEDRTLGWKLSYWSHLLVLIFGQLLGSKGQRSAILTVIERSTSMFMQPKLNSKRPYDVEKAVVRLLLPYR